MGSDIIRRPFAAAKAKVRPEFPGFAAPSISDHNRPRGWTELLARSSRSRGLIQMESKTKHSRRKVLKIGMTALAVAPLAGLSERAFATQNTAVRKALKYQLQPNGETHCAVCVNFLPNKDRPNNDVDVNGCKL